MKELTIEEKAKRYDNAIKIAKDSYNYPSYPGFIRADVVFPELKESEDERVRKELIEFVKSRGGFKQEYIAWLEKQERKPEIKVIVPKFRVGDTIRFKGSLAESTITRISDGCYYGRGWGLAIEAEEDYELVEPKQEWSEKYIADVFEKVGLAKIAREQGYDALTEAIQSAMIELSKFTPQAKQECIAWLEKQSEKDEEILILKDQIESLHAAIKAIKETHRIELEKQGEKPTDKIVEKARTEKQRVLLTETDGSANIDWDCRSLDDVKILLKCGLEFIRDIEVNKQILTDNRFGGCSFRVPTRYDKDIKQGEQKPADKVEPKFHEGEWITIKE